MTSKDWRPTAFVETAPGGVSEEETEATRGDRRRALYELLRHLMTLDALALVLTPTMVGRAFAQPLQRTSVGIAVVAFLVSLVAGTLTYLNLLADHPRAGAPQTSTGDLRFFMWTGVATVLGFVTGMVLLVVFFCANWFR
jgi:uncharacterized membrane protein YtjA (UPF0391 family)